MSAFELILAIKDYCNGDCKETCEIVTDLIEQSLGSHFSHDLTLALEEFIDCNCLCPICFSPMESKASYTESRGEYNGFPCEETITRWGCSKCSYIME